MNDKKISRISPLDPTATEPFYRQIYDRFRSAIASGSLKPGDRIPSARALTQELGLSRGTIDTAYSLLAAEGYIEARGQAGTIVTPGLQPRAPVAVPPHRPDSETSVPSFRPDSILPFQMGLPALDMFPRKVWARLGARYARTMQPADMAQPSAFGLPGLRAQIATYLRVSRGIDCSPAQVFVTSGYRHTLGSIARALLKEGDRVWLENPGYPPTRELLGGLGVAAVPLSVDAEGIVVAEGLKQAPRARAAVVTPAHQSPLSMSLSLPRRLALLDWAAQTGAWIVEDDYDGEYRYVSRPLPALKSLDREGRVLYAGTFSKVLFPSIRLAYLVVPEAQVERFEQVLLTFAGDTPWLTQAIVTAFMAEGHFARHIQKMRKCYAERRQAAVAGLRDALGDRVRIDAQPGGMHLILRFEGAWPQARLITRMKDEGLYGEAMSDWMVEGDAPPAVLVSFTNIASRAVAAELGARLAKLL
jgi:GntR family transcriptional regulator/MocR family aminotransferase